MAALLQGGDVVVEAEEHFVKQSYRNRCVIYGPNGTQNLIVPVERKDWRKPIKELRISYAENWVDNHWKALQSAYNNSPFFNVLGDDIFQAYQQKPKYLLDLNLTLLMMILDWLNEPDLSIELSSEFEAPQKKRGDLRYAITPKAQSLFTNPPSYFQPFAAKHGFQADLSVIDLIFSEGRAAWDYLNDARLKTVV
jgi:hypothetical protein